MKKYLIFTIILCIFCLSKRDAISSPASLADDFTNNIKSISNIVLNYKHDTIKIFTKRTYSASRNYYEIDSCLDSTICYWKFYDKNNKFLIRMANQLHKDFWILSDFLISIYDFNFQTYRVFSFEDDLQEIFCKNSSHNDPDPLDRWERYVNKDTLIQIDSSMYDEIDKIFSTAMINQDYRIRTQSRYDSLSYIVYHGIVTDTIENTFYAFNAEINNNMYFNYGRLYPCNRVLNKDTLFLLSIPLKSFKLGTIENKLYPQYFEIYSIFNGKKEKITCDSLIQTFLNEYSKDMPYSDCWAPRGEIWFTLGGIIDNTMFIYDMVRRKYIFYDYINKKFFDPVIKIIND